MLDFDKCNEKSYLVIVPYPQGGVAFSEISPSKFIIVPIIIVIFVLLILVCIICKSVLA